MRSCRNCIHKNEPIQNYCNKCRNTSNWEHDGEPSACDGCEDFGLHDAKSHGCRHCLDGSHNNKRKKREKRNVKM